MSTVIQNNYEGHKLFVDMFFDLQNIQSSEVHFDFGSTRFFEANLSAVFATVIEYLIQRGCIVKLSNISDSVMGILKKNGFSKRYGLETTPDWYDSTIPFIVFNTEDDEGFTEYLNDQVIPKINLPLTEDKKKIFKKCLQEVFENTRIHANSEKVYACGQFFPTKNKVAFSLVDLGNTIGENVRSKIRYAIRDCDAIDWATEFGNTTKLAKDGGIGLHFLKEQMQNNGDLIIISGDGYWIQSHSGIHYSRLPKVFPGTIVSIISDFNQEVRAKVDYVEF